MASHFGNFIVWKREGTQRKKKKGKKRRKNMKQEQDVKLRSISCTFRMFVDFDQMLNKYFRYRMFVCRSVVRFLFLFHLQLLCLVIYLFLRFVVRACVCIFKGMFIIGICCCCCFFLVFGKMAWPMLKPTIVVRCLHLSVPAKMFSGFVEPGILRCGHWSISTRRKSISMPDVPLKLERNRKWEKCF